MGRAAYDLRDERAAAALLLPHLLLLVPAAAQEGMRARHGGRELIAAMGGRSMGEGPSVPVRFHCRARGQSGRPLFTRLGPLHGDYRLQGPRIRRALRGVLQREHQGRKVLVMGGRPRRDGRRPSRSSYGGSSTKAIGSGALEIFDPGWSSPTTARSRAEGAPATCTPLLRRERRLTPRDVYWLGSRGTDEGWPSGSTCWEARRGARDGT